MEKDFGIGDVSKMSGVTERQIRDWEKRGYIQKAERLSVGLHEHRRFTSSQIENLRKIKEYINSGFTLKAAAQKVNV